MIERLADGVMALDAERRIVEVNDALASLVGIDPTVLVGQPVAVALSPRNSEGRAILVDGWDRAAETMRAVRAIAEHEVLLRRADRSDVTVLVTGIYERNEHGRIDGAVLSFRPRARRRDASTSGIEIVSTVSHELRSPLTSVKGYTSLLINRWDRLRDDQKKMMLEQVHHDADRVTRLITELLDISRLETGRLVLRRQMIDLADVASTVVEKVGMEYPDLDANVEFPADLPSIYADPDKVEQVLTNLVENACKYASPAGITVRAEIGEGPERSVAIAVGDQGEGIPIEDLPKVFTKFFRRSEGRPTGSGLGLWISRGLVEAHGGRLTAESIPGHGTTFRFTLPLTAFEELHGTDG
ncbi:MAG TPA: ATP-binding protein [Acidimicrobiales bacterium]|nr:ATP-binding protein [Acidimicrobiales bacterium]